MRKGILLYLCACLSMIALGQNEENDPDLPAFMKNRSAKEQYLLDRLKYYEERRGVPADLGYNPRQKAIEVMQAKERTQRMDRTSLIAAPNWTPLGPSPIPNGQTTTVSVPVSGRTTAIAIHPTNENIAYVGTANGGIYRTMNGGASWTAIFDSAQSLAIGALALAPSNPSLLYVGTGEPQLSADSYAGVGIYRIENADATPTLVGPINPPFTYSTGGGTNTTTVFGFRAISRILVHPTNPAIIFASTTSAVAGNPGLGAGGLNTINPLGLRGVYRSTNATAAPASITFTKLLVDPSGCFDVPCTGNVNITDIVMEPGNPNVVIAWASDIVSAGSVLGGGIYKSVNALDATPAFSKVYSATTSTVRGELSISKNGANVVVYAGTGESNGRVLRSIDSGSTWIIAPGTYTFCNPQCFYDIAIASDPTDPSKLYLAGSTGNNIFRRSLDSAKTFTALTTSLHADVHALAVAPSNPLVIYQGNDGGIYKSIDGATTWTSMNTAGFSATQFQSLYLHATDANYTLGGTQDNGTILRNSSGVFRRADFGDGGYAVIDQNGATADNSLMYHTYFNNSSLAGYARVNTSAEAIDGNWTLYGCGSVSSGVSANGITCTATTLFYAPLVLGPGVPNTVYFGTNRLYRSADSGKTNIPVSQTYTSSLSTISVSFLDDNYRVIGLSNGQVWASIDGGTAMLDITPPGAPSRPVGRVLINPANKNIVYVGYTGYGVTEAQHVWKTTNLNNLGTSAVTWSAAGAGIPDVPVNSLAMDAASPNTIYAGTDIGVFTSVDAGVTWLSYSNNLPVVPVFDMQVHKVTKTLRIATHGRGLFETASTPLPVTFTDFFATLRNGTNVLLQWYTATEINNKGFEVQRAVLKDGITGEWTRIGFVSGSGTTNAPRKYTFDDIPLGGKKFMYRLKQVDLDGNNKYSPQRLITLQDYDFALFPIFPNPVKTVATIKYQLPENSKASMMLYNASGKLIKQILNEEKAAGIYQASFTTAALPAGSYFISLKSGKYFNTKSFVIMK